MTSFFYQLTKRNWGSGWHAAIAPQAILLTTAILNLWWPVETAIGAAFISVQAIGYLYEQWQLNQPYGEGEDYDSRKRDLKEDLVINFLSGLVTVFLLAILMG